MSYQDNHQVGQNLILSANEDVLAKRYLAKLERRANNGIRSRWILLFFVIILFTYGSYCLLTCWDGLTSDSSVVDRLKSMDIPSDTLPDYWFVAQIRKTALMLERMYQKHSLETLIGVLGILALVCAIWSAVYLFYHWNDASYYAIIVKILRAKWNELNQ